MVFSGSNGCLYQTPTFKNRFPLYKKSISSTPVSMSTTLLLESSNWCLSSQRIIQLRCLILWYKCDLASCELPPEKSLSGEETKRRKRPARAVQAAGVGGSRGSQVWKTRAKAKAGGGSRIPSKRWKPVLHQPLEVECIPPAESAENHPGQRALVWCFTGAGVERAAYCLASWCGSLRELRRARGCGRPHPRLDPRGPAGLHTALPQDGERAPQGWLPLGIVASSSLTPYSLSSSWTQLSLLCYPQLEKDSRTHILGQVILGAINESGRASVSSFYDINIYNL